MAAVDILQGVSLAVEAGADRRHRRPERRRQVDGDEGDLRPGAGARRQVLFDGGEITHLPADALVARGIAYVPQERNVFRSLSVRENLEMGAFLQARRYRAAHRRGAGAVSAVAREAEAAGGRTLRRPAPDGRDGPRA